MRERTLPVRIFFLLAAVFCSACTTIDNDHSTHYGQPLARTQIDFQPPNRVERQVMVERENKEFLAGEEKLTRNIAALEAEREALYVELYPYFPECRNQRHCIEKVSRGSLKKFERWDEIRGKFLEIDRRLVILEADLVNWRKRHEQRVRGIYNRYLVYEILRTPSWHRQIRQVLVHSLEAFPDRRSLSYRLAGMAERDFLPTQVGDLQFEMMGRPVDEGAVLATFDVTLFPSARRAEDSDRYLVTFLVNSYQLDPQYYEKNFLIEWSRRLYESDQKALRTDTFCGIFSIASPLLVSKMSVGKLSPCKEHRARMQLKSTEFQDRFPPENWLLPVAFTSADSGTLR